MRSIEPGPVCAYAQPCLKDTKLWQSFVNQSRQAAKLLQDEQKPVDVPQQVPMQAQGSSHVHRRHTALPAPYMPVQLRAAKAVAGVWALSKAQTAVQVATKQDKFSQRQHTVCPFTLGTQTHPHHTRLGQIQAHLHCQRLGAWKGTHSHMQATKSHTRVTDASRKPRNRSS